MNRLFFTLGRFCILGALIVAPWTGGGTEPIVLLGSVVAVFVGAICALAALWTTPKRERRKNVYCGTLLTSILLTAGLALGFFQLVPLSEATLERVAPRVVELKRALLPPDSLKTTLAEVLQPEFVASENLVSNAAVEDAERFLSSAFPFADGDAKLNVRNALATDAAVENDRLADDAQAEAARWGNTISVYPLAGREFLITLWAAALLFLASTVLFNSSSARRLFWRTVVVNGLAFALVCVVTRANPALIYTEEFNRFFNEINMGYSPGYGGGYGTYVCKNAAAGYLVLVLAAAVSLFALEFLKTADAMKEEKVDERALELERLEDSVYRRSSEPLWSRIVGNLIELFNRRLATSFLVLAFLLTAIFASLSRGASLAACVALLAAFLALGVRRSARRFWPVLVGVVLVSALGLVATRLQERVDDRMSTLVVEDVEGEGTAVEKDARWENWTAALKTSEDYFWFGSGLGTYSLSTRAGDVAMKRGSLFYHAENLFIETLLETGVVGLTILFALFAVVFGVVFRMLGGGRSFETTAIATGGLALLLGLIVSASFDFGIYSPANMFLFVGLVGVAFGRQNARFWRKTTADLKDASTAPQALKRAERAERREAVGATLLTAFFVAGLCGAPWVWTEATDYVERTNLLRAATLDPENEMYSSISTIDALANDVREYIKRRDDCAEMRVALAALAETRFKLAYWEAEAAQGGASVVDKAAWSATTPDYYAELILTYRRINFNKALESIQKNPIIEAAFPQALTDLLAARRICPMYETTHERIARFLPLAVDASFEREQEEIELCMRRAASLAPYNSGVLFRGGGALRVARIEPLWIQFWRRSFEYGLYSDAILAALNAMERGSRIEELVERIVADDAKQIVRATNMLASKKQSPIFLALKKKGERFFADVPEEKYDATLLTQRALFRQKIGAIEGADEDFKRALELIPEKTTDASVCRYYYGVFLCQDGQKLNREEEAFAILDSCDRNDSVVRKLPLDRWLKVATQRLKVKQARDAVDARLGVREPKDVDEKEEETPPDESKKLENSIRKRMRDLGVD